MNIVLAGVRGTLGMTATPVLELWRLCLKPLQVLIQILIQIQIPASHNTNTHSLQVDLLTSTPINKISVTVENPK